MTQTAPTTTIAPPRLRFVFDVADESLTIQHLAGLLAGLDYIASTVLKQALDEEAERDSAAAGIATDADMTFPASAEPSDESDVRIFERVEEVTASSGDLWRVTPWPGETVLVESWSESFMPGWRVRNSEDWQVQHLSYSSPLEIVLMLSPGLVAAIPAVVLSAARKVVRIVHDWQEMRLTAAKAASARAEAQLMEATADYVVRQLNIKPLDNQPGKLRNAARVLMAVSEASVIEE